MRKASFALALVLLASTFAFAAPTFDNLVKTRTAKYYSEPQILVLSREIKEAVFNLNYDKDAGFKQVSNELLDLISLVSENGVPYLGVRQIVANYSLGKSVLTPQALILKIKAWLPAKKGAALTKDLLDLQTGALK